MEFQLRDYQQAAVEDACTWLDSAKQGDCRVYSAPTGVGKSLIEKAIRERRAALGLRHMIVTPRLEIARGFLQKHGLEPQSFNELVTMSQALDIFTPIRLRNMLFRGEIPRIDELTVDEGHHQLAASYRDDWLASGMPPMLLFTATPFRGTSRATAKFREDFGEPVPIITIAEAAARGDIAIPVAEVLPLIDDDIIELSSTGDFEVTSLESETMNRIEDMARIADERWYTDTWDRVTVFCVPTTRLAYELSKAIKAPTAVIVAKTKDAERRAIYEGLKQRRLALIQISVVGEGVDLPIRRLVDLAPCLSPVKWLQLFGRATRPVRPGEAPPEYIVTNRNLLRHAYLLEGLVPSSKIAEATELFGGIGTRAGMRALGLESLGRFKAVNLELVDGCIAQLYMLVDAKGGYLTEYACLCHPAAADPVWAERVHQGSGTERTWGRWKRCQMPAELKGFVSQSPRAPSEKQVAWWQRSAEGRGLKPDVNLTRKNFAALPLLMDLGIRMARR